MNRVVIGLLMFGGLLVLLGVRSMAYSRQEQSNRESAIYNYASPFVIILIISVVLYLIFKR